MKVQSWMVCVCVIASLPMASGCEQTAAAQAAAAKVTVEKLPDVKPTLPPVPTLPPPPFPIQYSDQSYSVYGLRRAIRKTINNEVTVTGYIAKVFIPPVCPPEGTPAKEAKEMKCPLPPAPHIWVADTKQEQDNAKMVLVGGYAENQKAIDEAILEAMKPKKKAAPPEDTGLIPVPTDLNLGAKIKLKGRFTYMSGAGFQSSEGVVDYLGHEVLEPGEAPPPPTKKPKKRGR
jgi:hypothetical protein